MMKSVQCTNNKGNASSPARTTNSRRHLLAFTATGIAFPSLPLLFPSPILAAGTPPPPDGWNYEEDAGPSHWGGSCPKTKYQSPVDLPARGPEPSQQTLKLCYPRFLRAACSNNAHGSPQIDFKDEAGCEVEGETYRLVQAHFHSPSEHTIAGEHCVMETHLLHRSAKGKTVVVAILNKLGRTNTVLQAALDAEPNTSGASVPLGKAISLLTLLPPPRRGPTPGRPFASYRGSLTTPPCTEDVQWFVFLDEAEVSAQQVLDFQRHGGGGKTLKLNSRPVQPLQNRRIEYGSALPS